MSEPYGKSVGYGYYGYVVVYHRWMLFATESEYLEFIAEE